MSKRKPTRKPKGLPAHLVPGNPGNSGGKKGRSGAKPVEFYAEATRVGEGTVLPKVVGYLEREDKGPGDKTWDHWAAQMLDYSKSKAPAKVDQTVTQVDVVVKRDEPKESWQP